MIYLTRLQAAFQFPNPYQVHLMAGALAGGQSAHRKCLHRFDHKGVNAEMWLQTKDPPAGNDVPGWTVETHPLDLPAIPVDRPLGFRVRLNPSICVQGKRKNLVKYVKGAGTWAEARQEAVRRWFAEREDTLGFKVDEFDIEDHRWRKVDKPGEPVEFGEIDVVGLMTVTDMAKMINTVENGVGRERAFGCGLLFLYEAG